ncbi:MAG: hypothetical protein GY749_10220 [Desulfobacteraceae bacterium]|nr:hypothetical protein [Desulfobacteraceae bacterium]
MADLHHFGIIQVPGLKSDNIHFSDFYMKEEFKACFVSVTYKASFVLLDSGLKWENPEAIFPFSPE